MYIGNRLPHQPCCAVLYSDEGLLHVLRFVVVAKAWPYHAGRRCRIFHIEQRPSHCRFMYALRKRDRPSVVTTGDCRLLAGVLWSIAKPEVFEPAAVQDLGAENISLVAISSAFPFPQLSFVSFMFEYWVGED